MQNFVYGTTIQYYFFMSLYPVLANESDRIHELQQLDILDSPGEKDFDEIVKLAVQTFQVSTSAISLIDRERQWFKARYGIDHKETLRGHAMCNYTILQDEVMEITDLQADDRFTESPLVYPQDGFRYYAGAPLISSNGLKIGTLCIMDRQPRQLSPDQKHTLLALSKHVMSVIELRQRNNELAHMAEMQNKIISIIGHDIRNPMSSFKVMLDLLDDKTNDFDETEAAEMNELLRNQMETTLDLLNNLVHWGKMHIRTGQGKREKTELKPLVTRTLKSIDLAAKLKNNTLLNDVAEDCYVYADEQVLEYIIRNLLSNANKFTEDGTITISVAESNKQHIISVTDTGVGMNSTQIHQILHEPGKHYTVGTRNEKGSGLGLSLVRAFLVKLKSKLLIDSVPQKGSTVSFTLHM